MTPLVVLLLLALCSASFAGGFRLGRVYRGQDPSALLALFIAFTLGGAYLINVYDHLAWVQVLTAAGVTFGWGLVGSGACKPKTSSTSASRAG
jgi:hypothetical protein